MNSRTPIVTKCRFPSRSSYQNVTVFPLYRYNRVFATAGCRIYLVERDAFLVYKPAMSVESSFGHEYIIWICGLKPRLLEKGCSTTTAPAVNLPFLCLCEIVSLIAAIAASIKTFCRKRFLLTMGHRAFGIVNTACRCGTLNNAFLRDFAHLSL